VDSPLRRCHASSAQFDEVRASSYRKSVFIDAMGLVRSGWVKALALLEPYVALSAWDIKEARPEALRPEQQLIPRSGIDLK
jgi:hypothetical protein